MRSVFAVFLRGFTLPFGATSGRRIVLDGSLGRIELYNTAGDLVFLIDPRGIWASDGGWSGAPPNDLPTGEWVRMGDASGRGEIVWADQAASLQTPGRILASRSPGTMKRLITESPKAVAVGTAARTELRTSDAGVRDFTFLVDTLRAGSPCLVAAAGPVGAIIGKVAIVNTAGTITGFLPVYDAIP